ncbi:hypothetical protein GCM10009630_17310 [Kribbella jejuensis]|uniref:Uncharacterized protein n=1 Tax=Kribbella jejuensis TaxID=236068 RepID=A0A542ELS7_9ACTN|nr:hypothetical protein FB475_0390 [Kribbella jejuensis]
MVGLVLVVAGCSTVQSKDVRTSGISATYVVTLPDGADVANVSASYRVGTLTFIELGDGESVTSSGGGKSVQLKHHKTAGVTDYDGQLDGVVSAGTEITFDLQRGSADESAPASTVKLPERVKLTAPQTGTTYSRRAPILVRFASGPSDLSSLVTWAGDCIEPGSLQLEAGRTEVSIPPGSLRPVTGTPTPGRKPATTCEVSITLTRRTEGTLDKAFKDGSIAAQTESSRQIISTP